MRAQVTDWLKDVGATIEVDAGLTLADASGEEDWTQYCETMATDKEWGDHITLLAACMLFQVCSQDESYIVKISQN